MLIKDPQIPALNWIQRPYPALFNSLRQFLVPFSFGVFVVVFLSLFQPFGIDELSSGKTLRIFGYGLITLGVMLINYVVLPFLLPRVFDPESWTVGRNILFTLWNLLGISIMNYIYNVYATGRAFNEGSLLAFAVVTLAVGVFPVTILVFVNELYLSGKHIRSAQSMTSRIQGSVGQHPGQGSATIKISGELKDEALELTITDLIYIRAVENYCEVHHLLDAVPTKRLLRTSLKNLESQLTTVPGIFRCHRSYLVNKQHVVGISANARTYYLDLKHQGVQLPISRSFNKEQLISS